MQRPNTGKYNIYKVYFQYLLIWYGTYLGGATATVGLTLYFVLIGKTGGIRLTGMAGKTGFTGFAPYVGLPIFIPFGPQYLRVHTDG